MSINLALTVEEFAAKRRKAQDEFIDRLLPFTKGAISDLKDGLESWDADLIRQAERLYEVAYGEEGGDHVPHATDFIASVRKALDKTTPESSPENLAVWLAVAILNSAAIQAAQDDSEELFIEWVTMHDTDVRTAHKLTEGQQRPVGEPFNVDGTKMMFPGDSTAPIELWINCRCTVRPVLASEALTAGGTVDKPDTALAVTHNAIPWHGVLAPEGVASGDGRKFAKGSLSHRPLPMPLTWQKVSDDGHKGNVTVAKIEKVAMKDGLMHASGHFIDNPEADEVIGLLGEFGQFGVSVDADSTTYDLDENAEELVFTGARVSSACIVPIPAFAEAYVRLGEHPELDAQTEQAPLKDPALVAGLEQMKRGAGWVTNPEATKRIHDYWTVPGQPGYAKVAWGTEGDFNRCRVEIGQEIAEKSPEKLRFINQQCAQWQHDAIGIWPGRGEAAAAKTLNLTDTEAAPALTLVASAGIKAPAAWFANPELEHLTPLTVTEDGQVFGHIAAWDSCHVGFQDMCVAPPRSSSDYSYFLSGEVLLNDGTSVAVGNITIGGGHADTSLGMKSALAHYDNTSTAAADISVGEDAHGIWCAGWIRPGTPPEMVYALRASALSGDWRSRPGGDRNDLELIAALAVNVPGFGIPRTKAAAANGKQVSLVASGVVAPTEETKTEVAGWDLDALASSVARHLAEMQARQAKMLALASRVNGGTSGV